MYINLILATALVFFTSSLFAQTKTTKNELTIVGTVHYGNETFNHKDLYKVLDKIDPDIILVEYSSAYHKVFGLQMAHKLGLGKISIEQLALNKYMKKHKQCINLGYDTFIPNRYNYIKSLNENEQAILNKLAKVKANTTDSLLIKTFLKQKINYFDTVLVYGNINEINTRIVLEQMTVLDSFEYKVLPYLLENYCDSSLSSWLERHNDFWIKRNVFMAQRIQQINKEYNGKKIVVLTGLRHKPFLNVLLNDQTNKNYVLLPFPK